MVRKSGWGRSRKNEEFYWKREKEMVREGGARPRVPCQLWKTRGALAGHLDADESQQEPKARMGGAEDGGGEKGPQAVDGGTSLVPGEWHSPK